MYPAHAEGAVVAAVAMAGVADQMVRGMLEVAPDLAEAPGLRPAFQKRVARGREAAGRLVQLAAGQPGECRHRRLLLRLAGTAIQRMVDGEFPLRPAAAYRQVALVQRLGHHRLAQ